MYLKSSFLAAVALAALALPAQAQVQAFGGSAPRMAATRVYFDPQAHAFKGMVCVQYGQPEWKADYDSQMEGLKGKSVRLGKDYWTTLNTTMPLEIGGAKLTPGPYYLGLQCDAEGNFHLAIMKAEAADKAGMAPFMEDAWKIDHTAALKKTASDKPADKLTIDLDPDAKDPSLLTLKITWGKHVLTVPVKATLAS